MSDKNILGKRVRERRCQLNMTQDELAEKMGYKSRTSIAKIETGRPCTQKVIIKLAEALETSAAYLMGWEDNLTTDNAELTVELMTRKDCIEVVKILLRNDEKYNKQVLQYCIFLETQK